MKKAIEVLKKTKSYVLYSVLLDLKMVNIVLITDASFENARDDKIQLGFFILMTNKKGNRNQVHYISYSCNIISRSVLAA